MVSPKLFAVSSWETSQSSLIPYWISFKVDGNPFFLGEISPKNDKKNGVGDTCVLINGMEWGLNRQIPSIENPKYAIS